MQVFTDDVADDMVIYTEKRKDEYKIASHICCSHGIWVVSFFFSNFNVGKEAKKKFDYWIVSIYDDQIKDTAAHSELVCVCVLWNYDLVRTGTHF